MEAPHTDPLRMFLWGKRDSLRHVMAMRVELRTSQGPLEAVSVDVSATGVMLRVGIDALQPHPDAAVEPVALVQTWFRDVFRARFPSCKVRVDARLIRVSLRGDDPGWLYLGCSFQKRLKRSQLRRFGLTLEDCASEADMHGLPSEMLPHERDAAREVLIKLQGFSENGKSKAVISGRVEGIGDRTVCVRLEGADASRLSTSLRAGPLKTHWTVEGDTLWRTRAELRIVGFPEDDSGALEVGLVTHRELPDKVVDHFRTR